MSSRTMKFPLHGSGKWELLGDTAEKSMTLSAHNTVSQVSRMQVFGGFLYVIGGKVNVSHARENVLCMRFFA